MQFKAIFALAILGLCRGQDDVESLTRKIEDLVQSARTYTFPVNNARFFESDGSTSGDVCGKFIQTTNQTKTKFNNVLT